MLVESIHLPGVLLITPDVHYDNRGYFYEFFNLKKFKEQTGLQIEFVQDNLAKSDKGTLRGLHFQTGKYAQAKLVSVLKGKVLDVVVDVRKNSPAFGKYFSVILDDKNKQQLFIPRGFAHAYLCLENDTLFYYKVDNHYHKKSEQGIRFDDPDVQIDWQFDLSQINLSEKDKNLPYLKNIMNLL